MLNQIPLESLPDGTVLRTTAYRWGLAFVAHYGVVQRAPNGQVVIDHNSKKIGHAATTDFHEFAGLSPVYVDSVPLTPRDSRLRSARTRADVERRIPWTVFNNCEDMKSRALTGHDGSPTREVFMGLGLFAGFALALFFGISALSS